MTSRRVIVHGGSDQVASSTVVEGLRQAARAAWEELAASGDAVKAAVVAVTALEDDPQFNAGTGAVTNTAGEVELDSGIVDGATGRFAAVAAIRNVSNPVKVSAALLEGRPDGHALLVGDGALQFAEDKGLAGAAPASAEVAHDGDTVGCIVVDDNGRVVAASSTGGVGGQAPGRVGDAPILGAGIFADSAAGVLCSGRGEAGIDAVLAFRAAVAVDAGEEPADAVRAALSRIGPDTDMAIVVYGAHSDQVSAGGTRQPFVVYAVGDSREGLVANPTG